MARRRKNKTHLKASPASAQEAQNAPRSFVIKHGHVGTSLAQLVRDLRKVMEPNTATRLKERKRNKLKDFLTIAPTLQVTHLLALTLTPIAPSLRIIRLPAGPTLSFRIERYSLMKDILNASRRARSVGLEYLSPPLLVLASFPPPSPTAPPHLALVMKAFQSLFPPLSPQNLSLSAARRVVLVSYNTDRQTIEFRHYLIKVRPCGISKRVRRVLEGAPGPSTTGVLDLGREQDVADFLLKSGGDDGYESAASTTESVAGNDGETINLAGDYVGRNNKKGQRRAIRLEEVGPRMELRLVKITEGPPGKEGNVIFHEFVKKSKKEVAAHQAEHDARERLRRQRKEEQERNVQRKKGLNTDISINGDSDGDGDAEWDEDEEVGAGDEEESEESEEERQPSHKRAKR